MNVLKSINLIDVLQKSLSISIVEVYSGTEKNDTVIVNKADGSGPGVTPVCTFCANCYRPLAGGGGADSGVQGSGHNCCKVGENGCCDVIISTAILNKSY